MKIEFTKMQGAGNDYIYVDCFKNTVNNPFSLSEKLSDRHFGIGGDGLVLICPSTVANAKMRMFNADGSEGKMCGNAIRCVAKYLCDNGYVSGNELTIETLSGIKRLTVFKDYGLVNRVSVDMGKGSVEPKSLPITSLSPIIGEKRTFGGKEYDITCVSVGNPHCVTYIDDVDGLEIEKIGRIFENDGLFPERVNTEFIKVIDDKTLSMRVWERGSGETLACGTGACASVFASVLNGKVKRNESITVKLLGGTLEIVCKDDDTLVMTGPAAKVFDGVIEI